jgi:iron complex outermembrane receptor protein
VCIRRLLRRVLTGEQQVLDINVSGKIGLNFNAGDRTLIYASVSRGFKSGGFQGQLAFDPAVLQPFNDEQLTAYELGIKTRLSLIFN